MGFREPQLRGSDGLSRSVASRLEKESGRSKERSRQSLGKQGGARQSLWIDLRSLEFLILILELTTTASNCSPAARNRATDTGQGRTGQERTEPET
jgi:hypothetical protein